LATANIGLGGSGRHLFATELAVARKLTLQRRYSDGRCDRFQGRTWSQFTDNTMREREKFIRFFKAILDQDELGPWNAELAQLFERDFGDELHLTAAEIKMDFQQLLNVAKSSKIVRRCAVYVTSSELRKSGLENLYDAMRDEFEQLWNENGSPPNVS
jgi:hypothetical protein